MLNDGLPSQRVLWKLSSAVISLTIIAVATYYGVVERGSGTDDQELGQHSVGAARVISIHAYLGQPDDYSAQLKRSEIVVEGIIDEIYPAV